MSAADKDGRTAAPGNLLSQWWSLGAMMRDKRAKQQHLAIFWVILDSYWEDKGYSNASVRFVRTKLAGRVGSNTTICKAINNLEDWGYVVRLPRPHKASPSRFIPAFQTAPDGLPPVTAMCNAEPDLAPVTAMCNAGVTPLDRNAPVTAMCNETYYTPDAPGEGGYSNVSLPPVADGLAATAGGKGFEVAWTAYLKLGNWEASRAAWAKIAPDAELAAHIIERAASWAASAKPGRRMTFEKWLTAKKWDEADRRPAANDNKPAKPKPEPEPTVTPQPRQPVVETHVEIVDAYPDGGKLRLVMTTDSGETVHDEIALESDNEATQRAGQKRWGALQAAVDLSVEDPLELRGRRLMLVRDPYVPDYGYKSLVEVDCGRDGYG